MEDLVVFFGSLADASRLRIMSVLNEQELCVCEIANSLKMSQPNISRHLKILKGAGIVEDRKEAQMVFYRINKNNMLWASMGEAVQRVLTERILHEDAERLNKCLLNRKYGSCC